MGKGRYKAVIFDLDGTLVDSIGDIAASVNKILTEMSLKPHDEEFYRSRIGWGLRRTLALTLPDLDSGAMDEAVKRLLGIYRTEPGVRTKIYDGVPELLNRISAEGLPIFIYTNKDQIIAEKIVELKFHGNEISGVFGAVPGGAMKPDAAGISYVVGRTGFHPEDILYAGDTEIDMETAANGRLDSLAVLWGYRSREELEKYPKLAFVERPDEIINWII